MTELVYREISCQKAVSGADFDRGVQDFYFGMGSPSAWIPSKSYFRIEMTLDSLDNTPAARAITTSEQVAFADNCMSALFNSVSFKMGGCDVSSINNYVSQAAALATRTSKTKAWLDSVGKSAYMMNPSFSERVAMVASDNPLLGESSQYTYVSFDTARGTPATGTIAETGVITLANGEFPVANFGAGDVVVVGGISYVCTGARVGGHPEQIPTSYRTALAAGAQAVAGSSAAGAAYGLRMKRYDGGSRKSIFGLFQPPIGIFQHREPLGAGDYRFSLNPNSNYKKAAVEAAAELTPGTALHFNLTINDIKFYVATLKTDIPKSITNLALVEMQVQSKPIVQGGMYEFTVPSSTLSLAFFVQANVAGFNTLYSPTRFVSADGREVNLSSLQITYANTTKPSTQWTSEYGANVNKLQQRYIDSLTECGIIHSEGGAESFKDWLQRGPYYYYSFNRDRDDRSTQVQITAQFSAVPADAQLFLVAMYSRVSEITVESGAVQAVRSLNV